MLEILAVGNVKIQKQRITLSGTDTKIVQTFDYPYCSDKDLPDCVFLETNLSKYHAHFNTSRHFLVEEGNMRLQLWSPEGKEWWSTDYYFTLSY
ncbi:hypothetical protein MXB_2648 [Myxobolus squamalis]|nr:hypothetical protein MXB_2648 [Myxobolus squamalis]